MQGYKIQSNAKVVKESRYLISEILKEAGFKLMAQQSKDELNVGVLNTYVRFIEMQAFRRNDAALLERLSANNLIR